MINNIFGKYLILFCQEIKNIEIIRSVVKLLINYSQLGRVAINFREQGDQLIGNLRIKGRNQLREQYII